MTHPLPASSCLSETLVRVRPLATISACLALAMLPACGGDERAPVPDAAMVSVLAEMHLLQARADYTETHVGEAQDSLLAAHGLDSAAWANAVTWYASRPEILAGIYGRVVDTLQVRQMPEAYPEIKTDSITTPQASPLPLP